MRKTIGQLMMMCLLLTVFVGCAHYSQGPWIGKVIDSETKQPIEGAVVVAVWYEGYASIPEGTSRLKAAKETLTDSGGMFKIDKQSYFSILPGGMIYEPNITIFKAGYGYFPAQHVYPKDWDNEYFIKPGAVVELPRWKTIKERREKLLSGPMGLYGMHEYKMVPNFMELLNKERVDIGYKPYEIK